MADEQRPPAPIGDEGSDRRKTDDEGEAYSHWLDLSKGPRGSGSDRESAAAPRASTIEEHAKEKVATKHQPPEPIIPELPPERTEIDQTESPEPAAQPPTPDGAATQDELRLIRAILESHARNLSGLRADLEKTAKRRHLWLVGIILLLLIAGSFLLDPESLLTTAEKLFSQGPPADP